MICLQRLHALLAQQLFTPLMFQRWDCWLRRCTVFDTLNSSIFRLPTKLSEAVTLGLFKTAAGIQGRRSITQGCQIYESPCVGWFSSKIDDSQSHAVLAQEMQKRLLHSCMQQSHRLVCFCCMLRRLEGQDLLKSIEHALSARQLHQGHTKGPRFGLAAQASAWRPKLIRISSSGRFSSGAR